MQVKKIKIKACELKPGDFITSVGQTVHDVKHFLSDVAQPDVMVKQSKKPQDARRLTPLQLARAKAAAAEECYDSSITSISVGFRHYEADTTLEVYRAA